MRNEATLLDFVAFLFASSLSYQTVRLYLCGVRHLHWLHFVTWTMPWGASGERALLNSLTSARYSRCGLKDPRNMTILCYGLLYVSFFWVSCTQWIHSVLHWKHFPQTCFLHKTCQHVSPLHLAVHLKRSKNDPFAAGMTLHLGAKGEALCPVSSMLGYLAICPTTLGPLFLFQDGSPLSRPRLVKSLCQALNAAGVDCSGYSGHSFGLGRQQQLQGWIWMTLSSKPWNPQLLHCTFGPLGSSSQQCHPLWSSPLGYSLTSALNWTL